MLRYYSLAVSALLLLVSFTHPRAQQPSLSLGWLTFPTSWYESLFLFCVVIFIPMMGVAFYYFVKGISVSLKQRSLRAGLASLLVAIVASIALYNFNKWVFSELF